MFEEIVKASLTYPEDSDWTGSPRNKEENRYTELLRYFENEEWIGYGRNRAVFKRGQVVVKIPLNAVGESDNSIEALAYAKGRRNVARCRLVKGTSILVMVFVKRVTLKGVEDNEGIIPSWIGNIDNYQVGYTRKGKLVAYDYAG